MKSKMDKVKDWADLILKVVSIVAVCVGGWWAFYQFRLFDTNVENVQIKVVAEVINLSGDNKMILVHLNLENIGKVPAKISQDGYVVTLRKIPLDLKAGVVDFRQFRILNQISLMQKEFKEGYELEPGVKYEDVVAFVVSDKALYAVRGQISLDGWGGDEVDHSAIVRVQLRPIYLSS